jgi:hypothetical protein
LIKANLGGDVMRDDEIRELREVFGEMLTKNRSDLLAIARVTYTSQKISQKAVYEELGIIPDQGAEIRQAGRAKGLNK